MPSASFSHRAPVAATPGEVWSRLQEPATWAQIGPIEEVWDAVHNGDGELTSFRWSTRTAGRDWSGTATTTTAVPGERMVVDLLTSEVEGRLEVALEDGSVDVSMSLSSIGFLATLFFGVVADAVGRGLEGHVTEFAAQFDHTGRRRSGH